MAVAIVILPDSGALGGPIFPTATGFNWRLFAVVHDTTTGNKESLQGFSADTDNGDSLTQVRDKIIAAGKAAAIAKGFTPTIAIVNQMAVINPIA